MSKDVKMKDENARLEELKKREQAKKEIYDKKVNEIRNLPLDQIKQKIKSLEASTQYYKGEINKMKVDIKKFNGRIKENKSKLLLQTGLPHLVSTV